MISIDNLFGNLLLTHEILHGFFSLYMEEKEAPVIYLFYNSKVKTIQRSYAFVDAPRLDL